MSSTFILVRVTQQLGQVCFTDQFMFRLIRPPTGSPRIYSGVQGNKIGLFLVVLDPGTSPG